MGDPTAVGRCTGGLLDGRWSGGGGLVSIEHVSYPEPLSASNSTRKVSPKLIIHIIDKKGKEERRYRTIVLHLVKAVE